MKSAATGASNLLKRGSVIVSPLVLLGEKKEKSRGGEKKKKQHEGMKTRRGATLVTVSDRWPGPRRREAVRWGGGAALWNRECCDKQSGCGGRGFKARFTPRRDSLKTVKYFVGSALCVYTKPLFSPKPTDRSRQTETAPF